MKKVPLEIRAPISGKILTIFPGVVVAGKVLYSLAGMTTNLLVDGAFELAGNFVAAVSVDAVVEAGGIIGHLYLSEDVL